jgi:feruloyl esterase
MSVLTILILASAPLTTIPATTCESLKALSLPGTTIVSAELVTAGPFAPPATPALQGPRPVTVPAACRVAGRVTPAVNFEVWMPAADWNGKFQAVGGGGFAGVISYGAMAAALSRGYATASTDTGHSLPGGSWALGHPELITDFAYRAVHEMTVKSKAIVEAFYGSAPQRSYFVGCSTGGRQGLMEAQRFPDDYDGIVAGAPANYWTHLMAGTLSVALAGHRTGAPLTPDDFQLLNREALHACDARDGVTDGLIANPPACRFDPKRTQCLGTSGDGCLSPAKVRTALAIYGPVVNPRTKSEIFPGMPPGGELTWSALAGAQPFSIPVDFFKYFVYENPDWNWKTMDLDKDVAAANVKFAALMNAIDPDLSAFKARGGKLIMYHGWNDQLIQPGNSINYYNSVSTRMGAAATDEFLRLFMAPGMQHCAGGVGPNTFDALTALEAWVERGTTPARMIASHTSKGAVDRTRPLCPYPQLAVYAGTGSIDDASSFVCK